MPEPAEWKPVAVEFVIDRAAAEASLSVAERIGAKKACCLAVMEFYRLEPPHRLIVIDRHVAAAGVADPAALDALPREAFTVELPGQVHWFHEYLQREWLAGVESDDAEQPLSLWAHAFFSLSMLTPADINAKLEALEILFAMEETPRYPYWPDSEWVLDVD